MAQTLQAELNAVAALAQSDPGAAIAEAEALLKRHPGDSRAKLILGMARRRLGDFAGARAVLQPLAAAQPNAAHAQFEWGLTLAALGDGEAACEALGRAVEITPSFAAARLELATLLQRERRTAEALVHVERLLSAAPGEPRALALYAACLAGLGDPARAVALYDRLLADAPGEARLWLSRGHALRAAGDGAAAARSYERAITEAPRFGEAWWSLANLKTVAFTTEQRLAMEAAIAGGDLSDDDALHLHYALGKALEDSGEWEASFRHYAAGARAVRALRPYDAQANHDRMVRTRRSLTRSFFEARAGWGDPSTAPIFIVGLPRSGSTLIEQILASHSAVEGTLELPDIVAIARRLEAPGRRGEGLRYPESLAALTEADAQALGAEYLERAAVHRRDGRPLFIDKMPNNFHHIGLIQLILPRARIIDARRGAMAAGFAAFKQHFARGQAFSYDLGDIGRYYRDYVALMDHWDEALPGRVHLVSYEALVDDLEAETRRLLDYLGLPFEDACLRFHETRRPVRTASSEQVRRPIFREGLDQWRHYAPWLAALEEGLG